MGGGSLNHYTVAGEVNFGRHRLDTRWTTASVDSGANDQLFLSEVFHSKGISKIFSAASDAQIRLNF